MIRTDKMADQLGLNVQDLQEILGMGRASIFSYRTGKRPITRRAWSKLEAAEKKVSQKSKASIEEYQKPEPIAESLSRQNLSSCVQEENLDDIHKRLLALETQVRVLTQAVGSLIPQGQPAKVKKPSHESA